MDTRGISFDILKKIESEDAYTADVLHMALRRHQFEDKRERAFVTRLVEGVTERKISLDHLISKFSKGSKKKENLDIQIVLRMAVYQIRYMEAVPNRAAISEAVDMAKAKGYEGLSGYINGLLRNVAKASEEGRLDSYLVSRMDTRYSTPDWLCSFLVKTFGKDTAKLILEDQYEEHDTVIRVNTLKTSKQELKDRLMAKGVSVKDGILTERALRISEYDSVQRLPGFRNGEFLVQDETSIYTVERIGIKPGDTVLDMCASPGGKSLLAYELTVGDRTVDGVIETVCGKVVSCDISERKIETIQENAERLGIPVSDESIPLGIEVRIADATDPANGGGNSADELFDVVIADVPCSGLGIIGRKNDIKYHASLEGMKELAEQGLVILRNAACKVKPGGRICFSTCTINPGENQDTVRAFLGITDANAVDAVDTSETEERTSGNGFRIIDERTFIQGVDGSDGFYFCIMEKCK